MSIGTRYKDPSATLDYSIVWTSWLTATETIATSTWAVSPNDATLTVVSSSNSTIDTVIWLSGGTLGVTYVITNRITTTSATPRIDERSFSLKITDQ